MQLFLAGWMKGNLGRSSFGHGWLELPIFPPRRADCRLTGEEVATSLFQSTIDNQQSAIVASLLVHLRVVAHFHSLHQEQNIFGNVGGVISEAL